MGIALLVKERGGQNANKKLKSLENYTITPRELQCKSCEKLHCKKSKSLENYTINSVKIHWELHCKSFDNYTVKSPQRELHCKRKDIYSVNLVRNYTVKK